MKTIRRCLLIARYEIERSVNSGLFQLTNIGYANR